MKMSRQPGVIMGVLLIEPAIAEADLLKAEVLAETLDIPGQIGVDSVVARVQSVADAIELSKLKYIASAFSL